MYPMYRKRLSKEGTTKCGTSCKGTTSTTNVVLFVVLQANKTFNFFRQLMIWQLTSELLSNPSSSSSSNELLFELLQGR